MTNELTPYERWQREMYGDILQHRNEACEELENGFEQSERDSRRIEAEEDHWFNEQEF